MTSIKSNKNNIEPDAKEVEENFRTPSQKTEEMAVKISQEALFSLENLQKNSLEIIQAIKEVVLSMQLAFNQGDVYAEKNELAIKRLMAIIDANGASLERGSKKYNNIHDITLIDPLTGLPTRPILDDRINQIILNNKRWNSYSAAIFIDLDNFKEVNETYGHATGDELLIAFGKRLKECIRESDTVARYGGDEFVVIIDRFDGNLKEAKKLAQKIANKLLNAIIPCYTLNVHDQDGITKTIEFECFASLGIAMFNGVMADKENVIEWANKAMYIAKSAGGKSIQFAD